MDGIAAIKIPEPNSNGYTPAKTEAIVIPNESSKIETPVKKEPEPI